MKTHFIFSLRNNRNQWLDCLPTLLAAGFLLATARPLAAANDDYARQLAQARLFPQPLMWVGTNAPSREESYEVYQAAGLDASAPSPDVIGTLDIFVQMHPDSPWTPSLEANLARYHRTQGRYSIALEYWQKAWQATKDSTDPRSRTVADYTIAYWSQLLSSLGRVDELDQIIGSVNGRPLSSPEFQRQFDLARQADAIMKHDPGVAYRCGTLALFNVAQAMGVKTNVSALIDMVSPRTGFSLFQLMQLSDQYQLGLVAVKRPSGNQLVVPSVVHWKETHYAAIVAKRDGGYKVIDPTFGRPQWLSAGTINQNASGYFLVPANLIPAHWQLVSTNEAQKIYGKGVPNGGNPKPPQAPCPSGDPCETCPVPCGPGSGSGGHGSTPGHSGPGGGPGSPGSGSGGFGGNVGSCGSCNGMADWEVQEPYVSLWLHDRPMVYNMSFGRQFVLEMDYHQRETRPYDTGIFNFGPNWNCNLITYIQVDGDVVSGMEAEDCGTDCCMIPYTTGGFQAAEYCPDGGERDFWWGGTNYDTTTDPRSHIQFVPSEYQTTSTVIVCGDASTQYIDHFASNSVVYPNGSVAIFNFVVTVSEYPEQRIAFLTSATDPYGHTMRYFYSTNDNLILLTQVVDFDGKTNKFVYGNTNYPASITQITNTAYGLAVNFSYDANGLMTNITDVMGMGSSFVYVLTNDVVSYWTDGNDWTSYYETNSTTLLTDLQTPYGTTHFDYFRPTSRLFADTPDADINRAITVTQPDGGKNLYLYKDNGNSPSSIQNAPSWYCGGTDDTSAQLAIFEASDLEGELDHDDSFYWGPRQYESLSSTILTNFDANDFVSARTRNWLHTSPDDNAFALSQTLNAEQDFSPDGSNPGLSTWYGYEGKPFSSRVLESTNDNLPCNTGFITFYWDGERQEVIDHYENITRNALGYPTSDVIFGNDASCEVFIKTNRYVYAANGIDLLQHIGPDGVVQESYGYNTNHEVLTMTNALGEVTRYSYNANGQLTSIIQPNGLLTTNIYGSDGFLAQQVIVGFSTNSYTYTNGLVFTHTDERGLTITNTWDKLQRLTKVSYPDGASISYLYTNLDLIRVVDRMGFTNSYGYDPMGRKIAETNADRAVTLYSYCTCGSLESIQNALHSWTYFYYDQVGHLTNTVYADGHSVGRVYDTYGLMLNVTDSSGNSVNNYYDPDLRLYAASNAVGRVSVRAYDVNDLVTNSIDANNVSVNMTYDNLHRLLTRSYPDGGIEKFGYAPNMFGPTSYTNQIGDATLYGYDAMNRKTNETSVGVTTNQFSYNGASDLLSLTDGKNQTTSWGYDSFGRVTNKVDAAGITNFVYQYDTDNRLTIRWTPAKGSATYRYDPVGNLTNVVYPVSHSITLKYDALNRLTNMVDAVGTTVYGYDAAGQLLSEGGLWPSDTVSYSYNNRLRTALSIAAPNASAWMQSYGYDSTRRLTSVSSPAGAFNYIYDPVQLQRADELTFPNGAYITNSYDSVARLLSTVLKNSGGTVLDSESYAYNAANQRTSEMNTAGDFRNYTYDNEGELTSAIGKEAGGTANRWQEQFGYGYDPAGNLNYRTNNGFVQAFNVNNLNELSTVNRSGTLTVGGTTTSPATNVTVNTTNAFLYADATFAATNIPLVNGTNTFTAIAKDSYGRVSSNTSTAWMPLVPTYAYELNGNLLLERNAAGTITNRCFAYDDENELISVWVPNVWSNNFVYDGKLRRRIERDYTWNGSSWVQTNEIHFIYDGNVVVQERDANNLPQITYTRGTDLSGSLQGAGGIGGLLARTDMGLWTVGSGQATAFYHADGNGNITAMINNLQLIVAKYLYDSFGCTLSVSGSLAGANKYRFSSKEWNENAGLYYYLYRFYDPNLQRWPNHDPIGEPGFELLRYHNSKPPRLIEMLRQIGGNNLYEFVRNQPTDLFDSLGLHSNAGCSAIEKDMEDAFLRLSVYESAGDFANATIEMRQIALLSKAYADNGCWDPPPPPATCPAPSPVPVWPRPPGLTPVQKCGWTLVGVGLGGVMEYAWVCVFAL